MVLLRILFYFFTFCSKFTFQDAIFFALAINVRVSQGFAAQQQSKGKQMKKQKRSWVRFKARAKKKCLSFLFFFIKTQNNQMLLLRFLFYFSTFCSKFTFQDAIFFTLAVNVRVSQDLAAEQQSKRKKMKKKEKILGSLHSQGKKCLSFFIFLQNPK